LQPISHPPISGRAGSSTREPILTLFPAVPAFLPPPAISGKEKARGSGWSRCRVAVLELQHQQSHSDSLKLCQAAPEELYEKYFLRCLF